MKIIYYTPDWHETLLSFLIKQYPMRSKDYFVWWLKQIDQTNKELFNRTILIIDGDTICACTTAVWKKMMIHNKECEYYWEANTIVDPSYRGKGVGRILYESMAIHQERCTIGLTDLAYRIQPKIINSFKTINFVHIYLIINKYLAKSLYNRLFKERKNIFELTLSDTFKMKNTNMVFSRSYSVDDIEIPNNGYWIGDKVELKRDASFIKTRFFDIYKKNYVYKGCVNNKTEAYFVVRWASYKGVDMLSLVDYRCKNLKQEKAIFKAVDIIAKQNQIGLSIILTSRIKKSIDFFPITLQMRKKILGATSLNNIMSDDFILITSADSDLDFVYYR